MNCILPARACVAVLAMHALGCAATVSPDDVAAARIHYDLGVTSINRNDLRGALRELRIAVQIDPTMHQAHNALGLVYHAMGKTDESLQHYSESVRRKPDFSEAHNNLGILLLDLGRYDDAIEAFKVALSDILYATPALAEGNLGWAFYRKGDVERAKRHLKNSVAVSPKFCRGYEWLARIGLETNEPKQVVTNALRFERHCAQDPQIADTLPADYTEQMQYYLAMGYLRTGETTKAKMALSQCAHADDSDPDPDDVSFAAKCSESLRRLD